MECPYKLEPQNNDEVFVPINLENKSLHHKLGRLFTRYVAHKTDEKHCCSSNERFKVCPDDKKKDYPKCRDCFASETVDFIYNLVKNCYGDIENEFITASELRRYILKEIKRK